MKTSVKKLFGAIQGYIMLLLIVTIAVGLVSLSALPSFERIKNVNEQFALVSKVMELDHNDLQFSRVELQGVRAQMASLVGRLTSTSTYEVINQYYIQEGVKRQDMMPEVGKRYSLFIDAAEDYFENEAPGTLDKRQLALERTASDYREILYKLNALQEYAVEKIYEIVNAALIFLLVVISLVFLFVGRVDRKLFSDISALMWQESARASYVFKTSEFHSLAHRLSQESGGKMASAMKDSTTGLLNYEGLQRTFGQRFTKANATNIHVCYFEIDNFKELTEKFQKRTVDEIMMKIASIFKLYQNPTDLVARVDNNHFIAVFARSDKKKALTEFDHIRSTVASTRFKLDDHKSPVTLSGGFTSKSSTQTLDDVVKNARKYLMVAIEMGGNVIAEPQDLTKVMSKS